ncbi:nitroreductase family deazaflavin-dependent oxidoreductase [Nocardia sp. NPDC005366]|uniref:nitroreductase family deazaflavin-dependent oxidoreductase n=1 Tax=Nocardia sp. NPDC005366 TaxID=3156878 RepID=UPI0033B5ACB2
MVSNPLPNLARWLGRQPWVMGTARFVLPTERLIRALSRNRIGVLDIAGLPSLRMTVTGRKSGLPRETSLLYVPRGEDFLIIGSNWGSRQHPVWSANLRAAGTALVRLHGETFPVSATEIDGVDRERAWDLAVEFWPGYRVEERLAGGREFRIFELRRR